MDYCDVAWSSIGKIERDKLYRVQRRVAVPEQSVADLFPTVQIRYHPAIIPSLIPPSKLFPEREFVNAKISRNLYRIFWQGSSHWKNMQQKAIYLQAFGFEALKLKAKTRTLCKPSSTKSFTLQKLSC